MTSTTYVQGKGTNMMLRTLVETLRGAVLKLSWTPERPEEKGPEDGRSGDIAKKEQYAAQAIQMNRIMGFNR